MRNFSRVFEKHKKDLEKLYSRQIQHLLLYDQLQKIYNKLVIIQPVLKMLTMKQWINQLRVLLNQWPLLLTRKRQGVEYEHLPKTVPMNQAVKKIMSSENKQILFVTGAGVSVQSGIPTFRGKNGLYSKMFVFQGKQMTPQQFISKSFFNQHPQPIWQWIDQIYTMSTNSKSNQIHCLIHQCLVQLSKKGMKPVLVTQNIDNLHIEPKKQEYEYHRVHGEVDIMRCSNMHKQKYDKKLINEKCEKCFQPLRPHVMFFDESYGIEFGGQVKDRKFDCVVVIGSSLNTGLCVKLVSGAKKMIEINPEPVIEVGEVYQFKQSTEDILREMLKEIVNF